MADAVVEQPTAAEAAVSAPNSTKTSSDPSLATARSGRESPSKSPTATDCGREPAGMLVALPKLPSPVPSRTETLFEPLFAVTRSGCPSRLKSPTASECGLLSPGNSVAGGNWVAGNNLPSPLPSSTETLPELAVASATSRRWSPSKSLTATEQGLWAPARRGRT
jgi:hypothetical protein